MHKKGRLVSIEGIDFSGKTTLKENLVNEESDVRLLPLIKPDWEPVPLPLSDTPIANLCYFVAKRACFQPVMGGKLEEGRDLLIDRYIDSTIAYQTVELGEHLGDRNAARSVVRSLSLENVIKPDLTIYLDIDTETYNERRAKSEDLDHYELQKDDHVQAIMDEYERLINEEPERFVRVDATQSPLEIQNEVVGHLKHELRHCN